MGSRLLAGEMPRSRLTMGIRSSGDALNIFADDSFVLPSSGTHFGTHLGTPTMPMRNRVNHLAPDRAAGFKSSPLHQLQWMMDRNAATHRCSTKPF